MRRVPDRMTEAWYSGDYIGDQRPIARVTVQYTRLGLHRTPTNLWTSLPFGSSSPPRELPNVKSVSWDRDVDGDAAEATIEFWNTEPLPIGAQVTRDLDQPGYFTYNRGRTTYSVRWGHKPTEWSGAVRFTPGSGYLIPDNTLRTYEGYGFDADQLPEDDPHLVQTGCWLIDEVEYTHDGIIICRCRDYARVLLDQMMFPPVIQYRTGHKTPKMPHGAWAYPLSFTGTAAERDRDLINYRDYTDCVKLLCGLGGFFWPRGARVAKTAWPDQHVPGNEDAEFVSFPFLRDDPVLPLSGVGRIWGDFAQTGTTGPATIGVETFDKKPLMDGINYVREIVGFIFYVDELGGAVWRPPNIYRLGNTWRTLGDRSGERTNQMITIDERQTLIGLRATLSSRNIRERVFVSDAIGKNAGMAQGWNPNPTNMRRVAGWTDQHFESEAECQVMAEMIALRQLFSYRTDAITIPGYPAIQIDDQLRIYEAVVGEGYVHYVKSISSNNDLESGEWTYDLNVHWLGERPFTSWAFDPAELSSQARIWLNRLYGTPTSEEPVPWGDWV